MDWRTIFGGFLLLRGGKFIGRVSRRECVCFVAIYATVLALLPATYLYAMEIASFRFAMFRLLLDQFVVFTLSPFVQWIWTASMVFWDVRGPDVEALEALYPTILLLSAPLAYLNAVRRLHDAGLTGLLVLLPGAVAIVGIPLFEMLPFALLGSRASLYAFALGPSAILAIFMLLPGTRGPNRFGPDPREKD